MVKNLNPDFKKVVLEAQQILVCSNEIKDFPFLLYKVIYEMTDISIRKYSDIEEKGISATSLFSSEEGELMEQNGRYILFYNDKLQEIINI